MKLWKIESGETILQSSKGKGPPQVRTVLPNKALNQAFSKGGPRTRAAAPPGNLLKRQILKSQCRSKELKLWGVGPNHLDFNKPVR